MFSSAKKRGASFHMGDLNGNTGNSTQVFRGKGGIYIAKDNATDESVNILGLVHRSLGGSWSETMAYAKKLCGINDVKQVARKPKPSKPSVKRYKLQGTKQCDYLLKRGIQPEVMDKYHVTRVVRQDLPPSKQERWNNEYLSFAFMDTEGDMVMRKWLGLNRKGGKKEIGTTFPQYATLWGWWLVDDNTRQVLIAEGECLTGDTEVLTQDGWVDLSSYDETCRTPVMTFSASGEGSFDLPSAKIDKEYNDELIRWVSPQLDMSVTPGHNVVYRPQHSKLWRKKKAHQIRSQISVPKSVKYHSSSKLDLTDDQIRLCIAVSADAAIHKRKHVNDYAWFGLKKERKVIRLRKILESCGIEYRENLSKGVQPGYHQIKFTLPDWCEGRMLPWSFASSSSYEQREMILDELVEWDGNRVPNRNQTEYSSKHEHNADVVQAIAHLTNRSSTKIYRSNEFGNWIKVSILHSKQTASICNNQKTSEYVDRVYCLTVPSGMLLVRRNGKVFVTGNCDAMSVDQMCPNIPSLSMPSGASNLDWINNDFERLQQFERIYILTDMDAAGEQAAQKIAKRLGLTRCFRISLPTGYKDANDFLLSKEAEKPTMQSLLDDAATYDPQQLRSANQMAHGLAEEIARFEEEQQSNPFMWDIPFRFRHGEMTVVTGYPGHGKSQWLYQAVLHEMIANGRRVCIASFEIPAKTMLFNLLWMLNGRSPTAETYQRDVKAFEDLLWFIEGEEGSDTSWGSLKEDFLYANRRFGCDLFVVDALMHLTKKGDAEGTDQVAKQAAKFCVNNDTSMMLVCHADAKKRGNDHVAEVEDVLGGQGIGGAAHNVVSVWRNKKKERDEEEGKVNPEVEDGRIYISKQRQTGITVYKSVWFSKSSRKFRLTSESNDTRIGGQVDTGDYGQRAPVNSAYDNEIPF